MREDDVVVRWRRWIRGDGGEEVDGVGQEVKGDSRPERGGLEVGLGLGECLGRAWGILVMEGGKR
jgi:hypothetical protein